MKLIVLTEGLTSYLCALVPQATTVVQAHVVTEVIWEKRASLMSVSGEVELMGAFDVEGAEGS